MRIAVPAYFHPVREADDWTRLRTAEAAVVVINPDSGPGHGEAPYRVSNLGTVGLVAGYVDTAYATRALAAVLDEAAAYRAWYDVGALFADRVTSSAADLSYYRELAGAFSGALLLNPGVRPDPGYLELADLVVTFEGSGESHRELTGADPRGRAVTCHLVHGVPVGEQWDTVHRAHRSGASLAYATERSLPNPWDGMAGSWSLP